jgi:homoserine dehydrogenase
LNTIKVAILGLGTVGTGVYKLIQKRADVMERTAGAKLEVKKILVRNMQKKREGVEQELLTDNWKEILEDDEISVVIEVMGGLEPAKTMILEALEAGKNVVSANKDLIAEEGHVLLDTAQKNQVDFLFEAAVAGGIPIIRPLKQCLAANDISEIVGIVNGTTNYILTKMTEEGMDFADALKKAQELGFAEADPTADVMREEKWRSWHPSHFIPELYSLMYIQKELRRLRQGILHMQRNLTASSSFWVLHIIQKMESRSESIR